jgi:peptide deformylase
MVKDILKYPAVPSLEFNVAVRKFDESLQELINDIKETIEKNHLQALAAYQIGSYFNVIVVTIDDKLVELINPSILTRTDKITTKETTAFFPGLSASIERDDKIKVIYQDINGEQQFLEAEGELSVTIQRKIDYLFGANFRVRMDPAEKSVFDAKLEYGTDDIENNGCPIVFKRDRILQVIKYMMIGGAVGVVGSLFASDSFLATITFTENILMSLIFLAIVVYFFYAQYEGKQYKQCTSCQIGNILGTTFIQILRLLLLFLANYFIVW